MQFVAGSSLLQGRGVSKTSLSSPFPHHPTPHLYVLVLLLSEQGDSLHVLCLAGDFCLPAESTPSGKIALCLAKEVGESQTSLIHLQIMQRVAFSSVSFFISLFFFFSIKKQMPDSCGGSLTTVLLCL